MSSARVLGTCIAVCSRSASPAQPNEAASLVLRRGSSGDRLPRGADVVRFVHTAARAGGGSNVLYPRVRDARAVRCLVHGSHRF